MRAFASLSVRRLTRGWRLFRTRSASPEAEFPPATPIVLRCVPWDARAADRASLQDALRPNTNSVIKGHTYGNSNFRETAAFARRPFPSRGLSSSPPARYSQSAGQEIALAKDHRHLHWRQQAG